MPTGGASDAKETGGETRIARAVPADADRQPEDRSAAAGVPVESKKLSRSKRLEIRYLVPEQAYFLTRTHVADTDFRVSAAPL